MRRVKAWFKSARGKTIWGRLLGLALFLLACPWLTVLWRLMLYGDALSQMTVIMLTGVGLILWNLRNALRQHPRERKKEGKRVEDGER